MSAPCVRVEDLSVTYLSPIRGEVAAVEGVSFDIEYGEAYGLVGESGSGKSTTARALLGVLDERTRVRFAQLEVTGIDLWSLRGRALRTFRATTVGMVYQDPAASLNPTMRVGAQVAEVFRQQGRSRPAAREMMMDALTRVQLPHPTLMADRYPYQLSGGQQQRIVIAMALANRPDLLILDEPTTSLDSQVEADIFQLIADLREEIGFATLLISHNLPLVAAHCEHIGVLRSGRLVESGPARTIVRDPQHEYTRELLSVVPQFQLDTQRTATAATPVVRVQDLSKSYGNKVAVNDVSFTVGKGETLGIVGESGSGKSTLGRIISGMTPFQGSVNFPHVNPSVPPVQMVFQNPDASLNPRRTIRQILFRSITLLRGDHTVEQLADRVGISSTLLDRRPKELSGGQKQRVAIARAFAGPVPLVICDEPTSSLDVSVQAKVIDLLVELQEDTGVSYIFITHDLAVVRRISHRIGVLYHGELVELQASNELFEEPTHPYTRQLVDSARNLRLAAGFT